MAKTRLQAKYSDEEDLTESLTDLSSSTGSLKKKEKYSGAVDCLSQVYREKGLGGWYQVSFFFFFFGSFLILRR